MAGKKPAPRSRAPSNAVPIIGLLLGAVGLVILVASVGVFLVTRYRNRVEAPPVHLVENPPDPDPLPIPAHARPTPASEETWWAKDSPLQRTVSQLHGAFPAEKALLESLGAKSEILRWDAYRNLAAKLPDLLRNDSAKPQLARLLVECYALDPVEKNLLPLRNWLLGQIPREEAVYPPGFKIAEIDLSFWALDVSIDALAHKSMPLERVRNLSNDLGKTLGFAIDSSLPRAELKVTSDKLLSVRCYRNVVPTAAKSLDDALAIRVALLAKISQHLSPSFREKVDLELAFIGLPRAKTAWAAYRPLLVDCLKSDDLASGLAVVQLYEQADPELAGKMEPVLANKWKLVADEKLDQSSKVKAIRRALGAPDPTDRLTLLEKLSRETLANVKAPAHQSLAILQETARLTHASTMACALMKKEIGLGRFDQLIANVPELAVPETKTPDPKDTAKKPGDKAPMGEPDGGKAGPRVFADQLVLGTFSKAHPIALTRGKVYDINMISTFDNFLRLLDPRGQQVAQDDDSGGGLNARIVYPAPANGTYRIVATSVDGRRIGPYTVSVQETTDFPGPGFGMPRFGFGPPPFFLGKKRFPPPFPPPGMFPGPAPPPIVMNPGKNPIVADKPKTPAAPPVDSIVDEADLNNLATNVAKTRISALQNISTKLKGDLLEKDFTVRQAAKIAKYLAAIADKGELEEILPNLAPLAKSRNLMLALSDQVELAKANQKTSESVLGAILGQTFQFGKGDAWRLNCRKMLLEQAIELSGSKKSAVTDAADLIRDYYKEQAALLGVPPAELAPLTKPSQVLEALIKHVADDLAKNNSAKPDKEQLNQVRRSILAAQFVAQDDLELTAMLQRVWLKVLAMRLEQTSPERAMDMRRLQAELSESDLLAVNVLEQLRSAEEKILRVWGLGLDLK